VGGSFESASSIPGLTEAGCERSASPPLREREHVKKSPVHVEKPWGHELIWAHTDQYVGKILHVNPGQALSLQYHEVKDETIFLLSGEMRFFSGPSVEGLEEVPLRAGEAFRVKPGTLHRMEAITECDILEASTPHLDDVVRVQDRYGRIPGGFPAGGAPAGGAPAGGAPGPG